MRVWFTTHCKLVRKFPGKLNYPDKPEKKILLTFSNLECMLQEHFLHAKNKGKQTDPILELKNTYNVKGSVIYPTLNLRRESFGIGIHSPVRYALLSTSIVVFMNNVTVRYPLLSTYSE